MWSWTNSDNNVKMLYTKVGIQIQVSRNLDLLTSTYSRVYNQARPLAHILILSQAHTSGTETEVHYLSCI